MDKTLIIVNGSLGVGKTTISEQLLYSIENSAWLDSDQVWWSMKKNENLDDIFPIILDNTIHCINNYFQYGLNPVIVSWFFPKIEQIRFLHENINDQTNLIHFMLSAKQSILKERHIERGDNRPYAPWMFLDETQALPQTRKIDTSNYSIKETVKVLKSEIKLAATKSKNI